MNTGADPAAVATIARARDDVLAEAFELIASGQSVSGVFERPEMPTARTFWRWIAQDEEARRAYGAALRMRGEVRAEEIVAIADEKPPMVQTMNGEHMDAAFVAWQKNRIDARKWDAAKMLPKKYGERTVLAGDPDAPLVAPTIVIGGPPEAEDAGPQ